MRPPLFVSVTSPAAARRVALPPALPWLAGSAAGLLPLRPGSPPADGRVVHAGGLPTSDAIAGWLG